MKKPKVQLTAKEVKDALRRRHPALQTMGIRTVPGPWTVVEELLGCDVLAIGAVPYPKNGPGVRYPRVGYEVKVSRSDYRKEIRTPHKRTKAVGSVHAFYLAVPKGLLRPDELQARDGDPGKLDLWVPEDVGLVEITGAGVRVIHQAPTLYTPKAVDGELLGVMARHISSHPDPRHEGAVEADRAHMKQLRADERKRRDSWIIKDAELREGWQEMTG